LTFAAGNPSLFNEPGNHAAVVIAGKRSDPPPLIEAHDNRLAAKRLRSGQMLLADRG